MSELYDDPHRGRSTTFREAVLKVVRAERRIKGGAPSPYVVDAMLDRIAAAIAALPEDGAGEEERIAARAEVQRLHAIINSAISWTDKKEGYSGAWSNLRAILTERTFTPPPAPQWDRLALAKALRKEDARLFNGYGSDGWENCPGDIQEKWLALADLALGEPK